MKTFNDFVKDSGFKLLSVLNFSRIEYKVLLYLLNSASSGISSFVSTIIELSKILGVDHNQLDDALKSLSSRNIIKMKLNSSASSEVERISFLLSMNFNYSKWNVKDQDKDQISTTKDALIFPFVRNGSASLKVVETKEHSVTKDPERRKSATVDRVFNAFVQNRSLTDQEIELALSTSRLLVDTYPVDQTIVLLKHFAKRINSLEQLAGSWHHFVDMYNSEKTKVDLASARKVHYQSDEKVRVSINAYLSGKKSRDFTDQEIDLLNMLKNHRHIRRQLFWAYQVRIRYPNLSDFFEMHYDDMLPVTKSGQVYPTKKK